jgi:CPA2 family monovalent cation:H+ antiporter-2
MRQETHDLILAAALLSISLNPFVFAFIDRIGAKPKTPPKVESVPVRDLI